MSKYQKTLVGIMGDGNAVGDNNRITVVKREEHHHHHRGRSNEEGTESVGKIAILVLVAVIAACYYFSRYADDIYMVLEMAGWCEAWVALIAAAAYTRREAYGVATRALIAMFCALGVATVSSIASGSYPPDIVEFAQQTESLKTFWCSLNVYGRQLALLHTLVAAFALTPAALLLLGSTLITAFFGIVEMEVSASFYRVIERATSWLPIAVAGFLVALAAYAHSDAGWNTWAEFLRNPPAWPLCPK